MPSGGACLYSGEVRYVSKISMYLGDLSLRHRPKLIIPNVPNDFTAESSQ